MVLDNPAARRELRFSALVYIILVTCFAHGEGFKIRLHAMKGVTLDVGL